ncbi:rhamnulokinase [Paenibacillus sp. HN-1]|uniref:rhamnulokinase n=1 Tax=Paenibacillus TaxID=44249 RepID=UPI001CA7FAF7|nr:MULTISPECIES: rhamnulokinase family protein [Paenibacillus]MBY9077345.1 rhamnulokinase [Paenibacillus sp. CGMCC 1.18879]MBY9082726.1 rhamnulokinase [Paenibacillus sinensis]
MNEKINVLAVDLGASSGRVILGAYNGESVEMIIIHRFTNTPLTHDGQLYWDVPTLLCEINKGIQLASQDFGNIMSLSVDTWGVDYGYIDNNGELITNPHHYRDERMSRHHVQFDERLQPYDQFQLTGNQPSLINTVYQLYADLQETPDILNQAKHILMMPDLIHYFLTGHAVAETTILSTSALLKSGQNALSEEVFKQLGLSTKLLPQIVPAGTEIGTLLPQIASQLDTNAFKIIAGASHDTASAVAAIPYRNRASAAFISCGTWSLVGRETKLPVLTKQAYQSGFTNEGCFGGDNRILKNINGLWLLQESQRYWADCGQELNHADIVKLAEDHGATHMRIDPNDKLFFVPGPIPKLISSYCFNRYGYAPNSIGEVARIIIESLADAYAEAIQELENLTDTLIDTIHMVGGGIQNTLLCQLTAVATNRIVIAGPIEASALGNLLIQLKVLNKLDLTSIPNVITASSQVVEYSPKGL